MQYNNWFCLAVLLGNGQYLLEQRENVMNLQIGILFNISTKINTGFHIVLNLAPSVTYFVSLVLFLPFHI